MVDTSVVIPIFNERDNVEVCYNAVGTVLDSSGLDYEIIFVDDGSTDGSSEVMRRIQETDPRVLYVRVARNVGQQRALAIGLKEACGNAVVTFDGDLQYDPALIVEFTKRVAEGAELVSGIRSFRRDSWLTWGHSRIGNALINRFLRIEQKDFGSVKAYSRQIVAEILARDHQLLCIPAMAWILSARSVELVVTHRPRVSGRSKWAILQRVQLFLDVLATYGQRPFQWLLKLGVVLLGVGLGVAAALLAYRVRFPGAPIDALLLFFDGVAFIAGVNFMVLAYIGEFVIRGYRESLAMGFGRVIERRRHCDRQP